LGITIDAVRIREWGAAEPDRAGRCPTLPIEVMGFVLGENFG
jgi:hypothetical protein